MSVWTEYLESLRGKRVAVIGLGVSNLPLARMLRQGGISVTGRDKTPRDKLTGEAAALEEAGVCLVLGEGYLENLDEDVVFRTPGLHPDTPALAAVRTRGGEVTSEMEVFFRLCPCTLIGVTGSDGKTTTATLISEMLKAAGKRVFLGGNIGAPLLPRVEDMTPEDFAVLELSSFQLMTMERSPHLAVFTNLSPNHLDYHGTMEEYTAAKTNLYRHQRPTDRVVFNHDCPASRTMAAQAPGQVTRFSRREALDEGVCLRSGAIWRVGSEESREILPLADILLPGDHNVENYMAAIAALDGIIPDACARQVASTFRGVEHRIELVREKDGVRFYNDSIGTSPSRAVACLRVFSGGILLIAGGYDKEISFTPFGEEIVRRVRLLFLTGDTAAAIRRSVEKAPDYTPGRPEMVDCADLAEAVRRAAAAARAGDVVVLSPACAAFDRYKNFMERGAAFKALVNALE